MHITSIYIYIYIILLCKIHTTLVRARTHIMYVRFRIHTRVRARILRARMYAY